MKKLLCIAAVALATAAAPAVAEAPKQSVEVLSIDWQMTQVESEPSRSLTLSVIDRGISTDGESPYRISILSEEPEWRQYNRYWLTNQMYLKPMRLVYWEAFPRQTIVWT